MLPIADDLLTVLIKIYMIMGTDLALLYSSKFRRRVINVFEKTVACACMVLL